MDGPDVDSRFRWRGVVSVGWILRWGAVGIDEPYHQRVNRNVAGEPANRLSTPEIPVHCLTETRTGVQPVPVISAAT
jgi:hypothetical protein